MTRLARSSSLSRLLAQPLARRCGSARRSSGHAPSCKAGAAFYLLSFVGALVQHAVEAALDSADTWAAKAGLKAKQARSAVRFLLLVFIGAAKLAVGSAGLRDDLERLGM